MLCNNAPIFLEKVAHMKASDLVSVWGAPDNSRLTAKQYSFRLPVHVAAKLAALCELYPNKSRTEIVGDLLSAAIDDVEKALPSYEGEPVGRHPQTDEMLYSVYGPAVQFRALADEHYQALEKELGNPSPRSLYDPVEPKAKEE
jgi:hypothetical protein